jgi:capsular polysaccharide transport system permease protein
MANDTATFGNQYLRALGVQGRVIHALIMRELKTRFWKNRLGYIWAIVEPVTHIAVWFLIMQVINANPFADRTRTILLLSTGMVPFLSFRNVASFMESAIVSNQSLLNFPVVRHLDLLLARFLLEAATMTIVGVVVIAGIVFLGYSEPPDDPVRLAIALGYALLLGMGFGMMNAVFTMLSDMYKRFLDVLSRLIYFCSGVMYMVETMPDEVRVWLVWNPVLHAVELFRTAYFPLYRTSAASTTYILAWALSMCLIGVIAARLAGARLNQP